MLRLPFKNDNGPRMRKLFKLIYRKFDMLNRLLGTLYHDKRDLVYFLRSEIAFQVSRMTSEQQTCAIEAAKTCLLPFLEREEQDLAEQCDSIENGIGKTKNQELRDNKFGGSWKRWSATAGWATGRPRAWQRQAEPRAPTQRRHFASSATISRRQEDDSSGNVEWHPDISERVKATPFEGTWDKARSKFNRLTWATWNPRSPFRNLSINYETRKMLQEMKALESSRALSKVPERSSLANFYQRIDAVHSRKDKTMEPLLLVVDNLSVISKLLMTSPYPVLRSPLVGMARADLAKSFSRSCVVISSSRRYRLFRN